MNKKLPPVSIAIPFYNAEATLLNAIKSVYSQTYDHWELILIDDGSTDRSLEIARSVKDPRIRVYSDGKNLRLAARLNQIPSLASFEYLARMDADDLMSPFRIERQISYLISRPDLDLVSTGVCSLTDDDKPVGIRSVPSTHSLNTRNVLLGKSGVVHASLLGKKAWFARNPYRENIRTGQDYNLWVRSYSAGDFSVGFISDPLYYYREDGNVSFKKLTSAYRLMLTTIMKDSGVGYSLLDKAYSCATIISKLGLVHSLGVLGMLSILRGKRNSTSLSDSKIKEVLREIAEIKRTNLPQ